MFSKIGELIFFSFGQYVAKNFVKQLKLWQKSKILSKIEILINPG